jgi:hypothetical protein
MKYAIIYRHYHVGIGWGEWSSCFCSEIFDSINEAKKALKRELRDATDDADYKIKEIKDYGRNKV